MRAFGFVLLSLAVGESHSFSPRHHASRVSESFAENILMAHLTNDDVPADGNAGETMKGGCLDDGSTWRVWAVIDELETNGLLASGVTHDEYFAITSRVTSVLKQWASEFAGLQPWQSLLNKNALLHEV